METKEIRLRDREVLYLIHRHADPDAIGSAYYLSSIYGGDIASPTSPSKAGKNLLSFLDFELKEKVDFEDYERIIVLDTPNKTQLDPLTPPLEKTIVIDHHSTNSWKKVELYNKDTTSCAEMIYEMIRPEQLSGKEGVALSAGIFTDTSSLQRAQSKTLINLGEILKKSGVTLTKIKDILFESRSYSEKVARLKGAKRAELKEVNGYILVMTSIGCFEGSVASFLLKGGADIVLVRNLHPSDKEERVTARTTEEMTEKGIDLGRIFKNLAEKKDGVDGGGHTGAAVLNILEGDENYHQELSESIISELEKIEEKEEDHSPSG